METTALSTGCVGVDVLTAWVTGTLAAEERDQLLPHIAACDACRTALSALAQVGPTIIQAGTRDSGRTIGRAHTITQTEDYPWLVKIDAGHYVIEHEIARGGMGRILLARDRRLGRMVAIKELLTTSGNMHARFEREARITAKLQHPGIVSVHEAGTWPSGEPFYAMKHVTGTSLDRVIADQPTLDGRLGLLPHVIAAVDALAYAHNARIIHRDLKPANVLVGDYGETVVIDWGLAKDLTDTSELAELPRERPRGTPNGVTIAGSIMGTPAYMPPEQATGENVDEHADVYALGAMLYHLLAGAPPYVGNTHEVLASVIDAPPLPIHQRVLGVPRDLVTIVEKAMARDPATRYPTAKQLAEDLKRFQTGQLVGAHDYSRRQLLARWLRRHRTPVAISTIAVVLLVGFGALGLQRIFDEQDRTEQQRLVAEQQRKVAEARGTDAEQVMSFMLGDLLTKLEPIGKLELLEAVAMKAGSYYARPDTIGDLAAQRNRASARNTLGDVWRHRGDLAGALEHYRAALSIRRDLVASDPTRSDYLRDLWDTYEQLGTTFNGLGDAKSSLEHHQTALDIARALASRDPTSSDSQSALIDSQHNVGWRFMNTGDKAGALELFRQSLGVAEKFAALDPDDDTRQSHVALIAGLIAGLEDPTKGNRYWEQAFAIRKRLAAKDPGNAKLQEQLAETTTAISVLAFFNQDFDRALELVHASLAITDRLVASDPTNATWQRAHAATNDNAAKMLVTGPKHVFAKHARDAVSMARTSLAINQALASKVPDNLEEQSRVAIGHAVLGVALARQNKLTKALEQQRKGLELAKALVARGPANQALRRSLQSHYHKLGDTLLARDDRTRAIEMFRAQISTAKTTDQDDNSQSHLARGYTTLGNLLQARRDLAGAREAREAGLAIAERFASENPSDSEWRSMRDQLRASLAD